MRTNLSKFLASLLGVSISWVSYGASFQSDFNSGLPAGSSVYGNTFVDSSGGLPRRRFVVTIEVLLVLVMVLDLLVEPLEQPWPVHQEVFDCGCVP